MGIEYLYISRIADGLVLVASIDQNQAQGTSSSSSTTNSSGVSGSGGSSTLRARPNVIPTAGKDIREGRDLLLQLTTSAPAKCSVDGESYSYHYAISGPLVCFVATDRSYPKKLAFVYLEEVRRLFWEHVAREYPGQDPAKIVQATDRPYAFIKFDRDLRNLRRDFSDPNSRKNMQRLQENLNEIQNIMRKNIDDLMQRGTALDEIKSQSQKLHEDSKSLAWGAKKLNYQAMLRKYAPFVGAGFFVLFFLWIRFYVML
jgi:vesicle transport protein SEC22